MAFDKLRGIRVIGIDIPTVLVDTTAIRHATAHHCATERGFLVPGSINGWARSAPGSYAEEFEHVNRLRRRSKYALKSRNYADMCHAYMELESAECLESPVAAIPDVGMALERMLLNSLRTPPKIFGVSELSDIFTTRCLDVLSIETNRVFGLGVASNCQMKADYAKKLLTVNKFRDEHLAFVSARPSDIVTFTSRRVVKVAILDLYHDVSDFAVARPDYVFKSLSDFSACQFLCATTNIAQKVFRVTSDNVVQRRLGLHSDAHTPSLQRYSADEEAATWSYDDTLEPATSFV